MNAETLDTLRQQIAELWQDAAPGEIDMLIDVFADAPLGMDRHDFCSRCAKAGLPVSPKTLGKMASVGGGPATHKFGNRARITPMNGCIWLARKLGRARANTSRAA